MNMTLENEIESRNQAQDTQASQNPENENRNREEYRNVPESGWEAGQGISNAQEITQRSGEDQNGTERGPSDAGIGMSEIRKKKEGSWGSGSSLE
jgi:hypothetical protein